MADQKPNFVQLVRPDYENIERMFGEIEDELDESEMRTLRKVRAILQLMQRKHQRNVESAMITEKLLA